MSLTAAELVMVSPLPPRRSGIASYSAELAEALGRHRRVVVVVERQADVVETPGALVVSQARYLGARWLSRLPHVYQMGNNMQHAYVYRLAQRVPGVLVLHDPVLHHMVEEMTLGGPTGAAGYAAALGQAHGAGGRALAAFRQAGLFNDALRYALPLHQPLVAAARGVLVHSAWAAARVQGARPVRVVPHHVSPLVAAHDGLSQAAARARLELPAGVPVLLSLGFATAPKLLHNLVLPALAQLRAQGLEFRFVIAGALDETLDLPGQIVRLGLLEVVRLTGWLSEAAFFTQARAADLLVNLRFPLGGESSGTLARALGMGLPALVFDVGPAAEWPDQAVYKLGFSRDPLPGLVALLGRLLADRAALAAQGRRAMVLARAEASMHRSVAGYLAAVRDWC